MLPGVIESRENAHLADAANLGDSFTDIEEQFLDLTRAIEDNNIRYTQKNAPKVKEAYIALELSAIKAESIGKVRPLIAKAEDEQAKKYVPQSLSTAKDSVEDTDRFITGNRYAKATIDQKVRESRFKAQRALSLNAQSKAIEKMRPEEIALWMEKNLHRITTQLSAQDGRNQSVNMQVNTIIGSITQLQNENQTLNMALDSQEKKIKIWQYCMNRRFPR